MAEFYKVTENAAPCILIISDHSDDMSSTGYIEQQLARRMREGSTQIQNIEFLKCIVYLKNPKFVYRDHDSGWCKILIRNDMNADDGGRVADTLELLTHSLKQGLKAAGLLEFPDEWPIRLHMIGPRLKNLD